MNGAQDGGYPNARNATGNFPIRGEPDPGFRPNSNPRNFVGAGHGPHGNFSPAMKNPTLANQHMQGGRGK